MSSLKETTEKEFLHAYSYPPRTLPTGLFYNTKGLKLWADIIQLPEYRQSQDEMNLLDQNKQEIASYMKGGSLIVDMGSGYAMLVLPCCLELHHTDPQNDN